MQVNRTDSIIFKTLWSCFRDRTLTLDLDDDTTAGTMILFFAFFIDVLLFCFTYRWVGMCTQTYYFAALAKDYNVLRLSVVMSLVLLCVRDLFVYGLVGLVFCWLIPLSIAARVIGYFFRLQLGWYLCIIVIMSYYTEQIIVKKIIFGAHIAVFMPWIPFVLNLFFIIGYSIWKDARGNRIRLLFGRMRKDRTPNRKDAIQE